MAEGVNLEIVSPERLLVSGHVQAVTLPGTEGYLTVLGEHAPLMTTLRPGFITVVGEGGQSETYYVRGGFADIAPDRLTILADEAVLFADFDRQTIEAELRQAQEQLAAAQTAEARSSAQDIVHSWMNLMLETDQIEKALGH